MPPQSNTTSPQPFAASSPPKEDRNALHSSITSKAHSHRQTSRGSSPQKPSLASPHTVEARKLDKTTSPTSSPQTPPPSMTTSRNAPSPSKSKKPHALQPGSATSAPSSTSTAKPSSQKSYQPSNTPHSPSQTRELAIPSLKAPSSPQPVGP